MNEKQIFNVTTKNRFGKRVCENHKLTVKITDSENQINNTVKINDQRI